jgi:hypothetical protein
MSQLDPTREKRGTLIRTMPSRKGKALAVRRKE